MGSPLRWTIQRREDKATSESSDALICDQDHIGIYNTEGYLLIGSEGYGAELFELIYKAFVKLSDVTNLASLCSLYTKETGKHR